MKIAISGGASQGKSTLVNALKDEIIFKDYTFHTNLTRNLHQQGIPINENGTCITQLHVMLKHYERLNSGDNIILDRSALDGLAYSMYFFDKIELPFRSVIIKMFEAMIYSYDRLFYIVPELPLMEDGERSINRHFFETVNNNFDNIIRDYNINVVKLTGSVNERIEQIKSNL